MYGLQRSIYNGKKEGVTLTDDQVKRLETIGMSWVTTLKFFWNSNFELAKQYYDKFGDINILQKYKTNTGFSLGLRVKNQRKNKESGKLSQLQIDKLNDIKMIWKLPDKWENNFEFAEAYYEAHGNLNIPFTYVTIENVAIGKWLNNQRSIFHGRTKYGSLSKRQIPKLNEIGMDWMISLEKNWNTGYNVVRGYFELNGNFNVTVKYSTKHGD